MPDFDREGIAVVAISYDPVDVLHEFTEQHGIAFPLLSDAGSAVIRRLGLLNKHLAAQHGAYGVPVQPHHEGVPYPGSFLLDAQGVVVQKRFAQSYRERETGVGILEQGFGGRSTVPEAAVHGESTGVRVRAWLDAAEYRFFQRLWLTVELTIDPGLHLYGEPVPSGFNPLSVTVAPHDGIVVGEPQWPTPQPFRIDGLDEAFVVHEGTVKVALPVTFTTRNASDQTLTVTVAYQACSTTDCLPPAAATMNLTVRAAALVP